MKTSELTGAALDWAVSKCEGVDVAHLYAWDYSRHKFSTDWSQGGPIIEREKIATRENDDSDHWYACKRWASFGSFGDTPLIAAMRCYVASKLGTEVEIPSELTQGETQ